MNTVKQNTTTQSELLSTQTNSQMKSNIAFQPVTEVVHPEAYCKKIFRKLAANPIAIQKIGATTFSFPLTNPVDARDYVDMDTNGRRNADIGPDEILGKLRALEREFENDHRNGVEQHESYMQDLDARTQQAMTPTMAFRDITHDWLFLAIRSRVMSMVMVSNRHDTFDIETLCGETFWQNTTENQRVRGRYYVRIAAMSGLWPIRCVDPVGPALDDWNGECEPDESDLYRIDIDALSREGIRTDYFNSPEIDTIALQ